MKIYFILLVFLCIVGKTTCQNINKIYFIDQIENYLYDDLEDKEKALIHNRLEVWVKNKQDEINHYQYELKHYVDKVLKEYNFTYTLIEPDSSKLANLRSDSLSHVFLLNDSINHAIEKLCYNPLIYNDVSPYNIDLMKRLKWYIFDHHKPTGFAFRLMGMLDLPTSLRDSIINHMQCPIYVKARLGDAKSTDSLINVFNRQVYDTTNYPSIDKHILSLLLYINTTEVKNEFFNALNNNRLVFSKLNDNRKHPQGFDSWYVITLQNQLLNYYNDYYNGELEFIIQIIRSTLRETYTKEQTSKYVAKCLMNYFKIKYNTEIKIDDNVMSLYQYRISPPPGHRIDDKVLESIYGEQYKSLIKDNLIDPYNKAIIYYP